MEVNVSDAFIDSVEVVYCKRFVDEETYASCCFIVARTSKYMMIVFGPPKFALVCAPSLVECDDVPRCLVKFSE